MLLTDLENIDLCNWKTQTCYAAELQHGLMGYFPMITKKDKKIVITTEKKFLKTIWESLPTSRIQVSEFSCMVNADENIALPLDVFQKTADSSKFALIKNESDLKKNKFRYAAGLLSLVDESNASFPD